MHVFCSTHAAQASDKGMEVHATCLGINVRLIAEGL